ncbi:class I SAM-dependent methyltransferase [Gloeothece citriformis]|uniref:class I SAM-dependent methyltransferase n=1 Tax=Gloeothece citriformis TaxID=2546356 RepID=UPI000173B842|nr:class I SAM-dependent methyltransferase [Gloeothece citriformis]
MLLLRDISSTAIKECLRRFESSRVCYEVADLLAPPSKWLAAFDFVFESYTLQVLPPELRFAATSNLRNFVAPSGQLLVIARGREELEPPGEMPYPLTKGELNLFENLGLTTELFEDYFDDEIPPVRRFRVLYSVSESR